MKIDIFKFRIILGILDILAHFKFFREVQWRDPRKAERNC
jgi:hypothetical protein